MVETKKKIIRKHNEEKHLGVPILEDHVRIFSTTLHDMTRHVSKSTF